MWGLLRWSSSEEPACKCKGHRFDPWSRQIPYTMGELTLCATTAEIHTL